MDIIASILGAIEVDRVTEDRKAKEEDLHGKL